MASNDLNFRALQPSHVFSRILTSPRECERLMAYLANPSSSSHSVYDYVVALKDRFQGRREDIDKLPALVGHGKFERILLNAGIVKTLFQIAKNGRADMSGVFTSYFAAEGLWNLIIIGTLAGRRELVKVFVEEHNVIDWCLDTAKSGVFVCHRQVAMMGLRHLVTQCFLHEHLTIAKTSEIMKALCGCILEGPETWITQLGDPATTWQSLYCFGTVGTSAVKARQYAPRYYSMYQENAAWTIIEFVGRYPVPRQEFYNNLIKHDPGLLDLLFRCAKVKREAWYAQLEVDVRTIETVVFMLNIPPEMVPGVKLDLVDDRAIRERLEKRWDCLMDGVGLLTARRNWCQDFIEAWNHILEESPSKVHDMLTRAQADYHAMEPYSPSEFMSTMLLRGNYRIDVLRLITVILHASEKYSQNISDVDLLNLFPISHAGCQVVKTEEDADESGSFDDVGEAIERKSVAYHLPCKMDRTMVTGKEDLILSVNDEAITGPICHIQMLVVLTKRRLFTKVSQWNTPPKGLTVKGGLKKLKGLLSEGEIRRAVTLAVKRLSERREMGNKAFREKRVLIEPRVEFWCAAQLAAALVELDEVSKGRYSDIIAGSKKELAMNLGNAAEMSLGKEYFDRALVFASAAVKVADGCSGKDEVEKSVREKNERRVTRAEEGIARKRIGRMNV